MSIPEKEIKIITFTTYLVQSSFSNMQKYRSIGKCYNILSYQDTAVQHFTSGTKFTIFLQNRELANIHNVQMSV